MKIILKDMLDQNNKVIFQEDLEIELPSQPYLKPLTNIRQPFYGEGGQVRMMDYPQLLKRGYCVVSILWRWTPPMYPNQKEAYTIVNKKQIKYGMVMLPKLPTKIFLNYDVVEKQVRLEGRGTGYAGHGKWVKLKEV